MFSFTSADGVQIRVHEWAEGVAARGVVQLAHGMGEHAARYGRFAEALNRHGFVVFANDHRGHGLSAEGPLGWLGDDGWNRLVADLATLTKLLRVRNPHLPLVIIGHSMGSFAVQQYLMDHGDLADAAVLSGSTALDALVARLAASPDRHELYNARFQPVRTRFDWLSRDESEVNEFIHDPLCGVPLVEESMRQMHSVAPRLAIPRGVPTGLPLYIMAGDQDPLNDGLAHSDLLVRRYRAAGMTDVTYRTYPGARHELFNEINRDEIVADVIAWITQAIGREENANA